MILGLCIGLILTLSFVLIYEALINVSTDIMLIFFLIFILYVSFIEFVYPIIVKFVRQNNKKKLKQKKGLFKIPEYSIFEDKIKLYIQLLIKIIQEKNINDVVKKVSDEKVLNKIQKYIDKSLVGKKLYIYDNTIKQIDINSLNKIDSNIYINANVYGTFSSEIISLVDGEKQTSNKDLLSKKDYKINVKFGLNGNELRFYDIDFNYYDGINGGIKGVFYNITKNVLVFVCLPYLTIINLLMTINSISYIFNNKINIINTSSFVPQEFDWKYMGIFITYLIIVLTKIDKNNNKIRLQ